MINVRPLNPAVIALAALLAAASTGVGQGRGAAPAPADQSVPSDLRPLLTPKRSEMRLVVNRYNADRGLLTGNYAGGGGGRGGGGGGGGRGGAADSTGGRGGGGRGAGAPDSVAAGRGGRGGGGAAGAQGGGAQITISPARIARLKRFDLSWQTALTRIDSVRLSADARTDLRTLRQTVAGNLARLDSEVVVLSQAMPILPFAPVSIGMIEARLRHEDVDGQKSAANATQIVRDIATLRARLDSGVAGRGGLRASPTQAALAAEATDQLRANFSAWFNFYNGYDPMFSWWMNRPYRHLDTTLTSYARFLRERVAPANLAAAAPAALRIDPAPAPKFAEVPNLVEIIALPQDELTDIVARWRGSAAGGGRGGGGATRDAKYYQDWLAALKTLDFDALTRNAQVNYLYIRRMSELGLERVGKPLPASNPRKTDNTGIPGAARGREGLIRDLQDELIPYTPEQLMVLAEREFQWHEAEMLKATRAMGLGTDWRAAVEKTKTMHVPPGEQPGMIRDLVFEAIDFLRARDDITIPQVAAESQRMGMMSPERQLTSPFFLGGSQITVSYPTDEMEFDARMQSMRGNNRPWSHATAFHEMIPGHNLVGFLGSRYSGYRAQLGAGGPFFGEGWPLYWELMMWDKGFHDTPEERVGALVWRMHRCARIIFSLKFHMGQWSPQEAIDFLVDRVGHERDNATAEVRRSFQGGYGPLYQAAYLLGGIQLRGLRREVVDTKKMSEKAFHDEIMRQGSMPIALIRLALSPQKLTRDMPLEWKFYGELPDR